MANQQEDTLSIVLGALADPTRRAIVEQLLEGPRSVGELQLPHEIGPSTLSKHLSVLSAAGLLTQQQMGRRRVCSIRNAPLRNLTLWVDARRKLIFSQRAALERLLGFTSVEK